MRTISISCIFLLIITSAAVFGGARAEIKGDLSVICPMVVPAPVIDGNLNDACWKSAPQIPSFVSSGKQVAASSQTSVYLACDDKAFYIAFRCMEPEMAKIAGSNTREVRLNDSVEVYLDADRDRTLSHRFVVDAQGRRHQEAVSSAGGRSWAEPWEAAVWRGRNEWTVEIMIPWKSAGFVYEPGTAVRADFGRNRRVDGTASAWHAAGDGFGDAQRFGNVFLGRMRTDVKGFLALSSDSVVGKAEGWILHEHISIGTVEYTPSMRIYPSAASEATEFSSVRLAAIGTAITPIAPDMPEPRLYNMDIYAQEAGEQDTWLMNSYQVMLPGRVSAK